MLNLQQAAPTDTASGMTGRPPQADNRQDALGQRTAHQLGREVAEFHRKGLDKRRERDLTAEKYLLHIDGEGDGQYADLWHGSRIAIAPDMSGTPRAQTNLLRPIVENMIAYHTTMPLRVTAIPSPDREARQQALIDQALANHIIREQRLNAVFSQAMALAAPYGSCPVHAFWRDDPSAGAYEPVWNEEDELAAMLAERLGLEPEQAAEMLPGLMPSRGYIDAWVGDPWDTVYSTGSSVDNIYAASYGRTLPTALVRQAFSHVPGIDRLEGSERMPSASRYQRIARKWEQTGLNVHGAGVVHGGEGGEELSALIYREIEPGVDPDWPDGRLTVVALQGTASTDRAEASGGHGYGDPMMLHDGPLPGGRKSFELVYASARYDDVHGKPYVGDLDDLQTRLNELETLLNEYIVRSTRPGLIDSGVVDKDVAFYEQDALIEVDPELLAQPGAFPPQFLELPGGHVQVIEDAIQRVSEQMFRLGGWQAASRGESHAGDAASKVMALARADDTIHGPVNQRFHETVERYLQLCWSLFKENADVGWVVDLAGDDFAHLADPYIDRTMLSDKPPTYKVVSGFGATPEAKGKQLLQLVQMTGADGEPLMRTDEFKQQWPDPSTFEPDDSGRLVRERRPKIINERIRSLAEEFTEKLGLDDVPVGHPALVQLGGQLNIRLEREHPVLMDDDPMKHLDTLSQVTQDETEVPLARQIAAWRQRQYYAWLAQQRQQAAAAEAEAEGEGETRGAEQPSGAVASSGSNAASAMAAGAGQRQAPMM